MIQPDTRNDIARVFGKIKMPERGRKLKNALRIPSHALAMAKTGKQILNWVVNHNWRVLPLQFGLPSQSHILADLVRAAGFEGLLYQSSKGPARRRQRRSAGRLRLAAFTVPATLSTAGSTQTSCWR
ncbi:MAG: hypothetical protein WCH44_03665 [Betaproteobacteria bacterium]